MSVVLQFNDVVVGGFSYSLSHLTPFVETLFGAGRCGADIFVRVSFQSHVFSIAPIDNKNTYDLLDESGRGRLLCVDRYQTCLGLPALSRNLINSNFLTWKSEDRNAASNMAVINGQLVTGTHYVVFYYLYPSKVPGIDVELVVKSAYDKYVDFTRIKRRLKVQQLLKTCYFQNKVVP